MEGHNFLEEAAVAALQKTTVFFFHVSKFAFLDPFVSSSYNNCHSVTLGTLRKAVSPDEEEQ